MDTIEIFPCTKCQKSMHHEYISHTHLDQLQITYFILHDDAFCVQEIPVDFQGHSITPSDYHGVKQLIQSVSLS